MDDTFIELLGVGISEGDALYAIEGSGMKNAVDVLDWLSSHPRAATQADEKKQKLSEDGKNMTQLQDMGFTRSHITTAQAVAANNTLEKLLMWLMTNPEAAPKVQPSPKVAARSSSTTPTNGHARSSSSAAASSPVSSTRASTPTAATSGSNGTPSPSSSSSAAAAAATTPVSSSLSSSSSSSSSSSTSRSTSEGKDELPPGDPGLSRSSSTAAFRAILLEERKLGAVLTTEQHNFLLLEDYHHGKTFKCLVCFEEGFGLEAIFVLDGCRHFTCGICMSTYLITAIKSLQASSLRCPMENCPTPIASQQVKRACPPDEYQRFLTFLLDDNLKKDDTVRWCPKKGCGTPMIGNPERAMMRCPKEDCKFAFCYNCKEEWHSDTTCEEYQKWKTENSDVDARFRAWSEKNTKKCPSASCRVPIQKNAGCNHMKCPSCKGEFCWLCMTSVLGPNGKYKEGHWALYPTSPCYEKMHT